LRDYIANIELKTIIEMIWEVPHHPSAPSREKGKRWAFWHVSLNQKVHPLGRASRLS
jgi:hypothetical protein